MASGLASNPTVRRLTRAYRRAQEPGTASLGRQRQLGHAVSRAVEALGGRGQIHRLAQHLTREGAAPTWPTAQSYLFRARQFAGCCRSFPGLLTLLGGAGLSWRMVTGLLSALDERRRVFERTGPQKAAARWQDPLLIELKRLVGQVRAGQLDGTELVRHVKAWRARHLEYFPSGRAGHGQRRALDKLETVTRDLTLAWADARVTVIKSELGRLNRRWEVVLREVKALTHDARAHARRTADPHP